MSFLNPLYDAVAWVMQRIHAFWSLFLPANGGLTWLLTIVLLVVLMRLILVPLFVKQMLSMRKMSALTPQLQELRKKYKNDKQTLNEETMRLYREAGVNPLGGCLPLLAQMPMFFALFSVLRGIADWKSGPTPYGLTETVIKSAQHANILGANIADKVLFTDGMHVPLHAKIVILCAVAISVTTTFLTVRQSTKRGMNPGMTPDNPMASSQKYMAYIVPFFALSGLYWAFGLVLYWVTTNVWTLGQQYVLFKRYPPTAPADAGAGTGTATSISPKAATAAGLVAGGKPSARRPASDAVKRPTAKPGAAKPTTARPTTAKPGTAKPAASKPTDGTKDTTGSAPAKAGTANAAANGSAATKPAGTAKPAATTKSAGAAKSAAGGSKPTAAKPGTSARTATTKPAAARSSGSSAQPQAKKTPASTGPARPQASKAQQDASTNGSGAISGLRRRFGKGRAETEEQPEAPEVKLVRQQRVRQSRSKRSGKR